MGKEQVLGSVSRRLPRCIFSTLCCAMYCAVLRYVRERLLIAYEVLRLNKHGTPVFLVSYALLVFLGTIFSFWCLTDSVTSLLLLCSLLRKNREQRASRGVVQPDLQTTWAAILAILLAVILTASWSA